MGTKGPVSKGGTLLITHGQANLDLRKEVLIMIMDDTWNNNFKP
jgi:hypothetical protein